MRCAPASLSSIRSGFVSLSVRPFTIGRHRHVAFHSTMRVCAQEGGEVGWGGEVGGRPRNRIEGRRACAQSYRSSPHRNPGTYVHRPSESVKLFGKKVNITARGDKGKGRGTHRPKGRREKTHRSSELVSHESIAFLKLHKKNEEKK